MTCDDCRWKQERHECPWNFMYDEPDVDYAYDCVDFRNIEDPNSEFKIADSNH